MAAAKKAASSKPTDEVDFELDADVDGAKRWEGQYQRSWDALQEDESGSLSTAVNQFQQQLKRRRLRQGKHVRRGIIRHLFIVLDMSRAMDERDLPPTRLEMTVSFLDTFITEYFDQNPISQLGIVVTRNALAEKLTELSGNPTEQIRQLRENLTTGGEPSLQNALEIARMSLNHVPKHGSREILVIMGSLTTCDPSNILRTIEAVKKDKIRCSIIGLAAELHVCRILARETNGVYSVIINDQHYRELMLEHVTPPPVTAANAESNLITMGFPRRKHETMASLCSCHQNWTIGGYLCPRCTSKVCELPIDCPTCSLTLVSSPHLARSYHHLLPLENFTEQPVDNVTCFACQRVFAGGESAFACPQCNNKFCLDCDLFIHEVLHNCVGCS